jgi:hypothetical protein
MDCIYLGQKVRHGATFRYSFLTPRSLVNLWQVDGGLLWNQTDVLTSTSRMIYGNGLFYNPASVLLINISHVRVEVRDLYVLP